MMQDKGTDPRSLHRCRFLIPILPSTASASFGTAVRLPDLIISGAGLSGEPALTAHTDQTFTIVLYQTDVAHSGQTFAISRQCDLKGWAYP